jgi:hypothetical protein
MLASTWSSVCLLRPKITTFAPLALNSRAGRKADPAIAAGDHGNLVLELHRTAPIFCATKL